MKKLLLFLVAVLVAMSLIDVTKNETERYNKREAAEAATAELPPLNVELKHGQFMVQVQNQTDENWTNRIIRLTVDGEYSHAIRYDVLRKWERAEFRLNDCATENGRRFSPASQKPRTFRVEVEGYRPAGFTL